MKRSDIVDFTDFVRCTFRWSKTTQVGFKFELPLVPIPSAYRRMIACVPAPGSEAAFVLKDENHDILKPITYTKFQKFFRQLVSQTGRDGKKYSSHSFRRGGATFALQFFSCFCQSVKTSREQTSR